MAKYVTLNIEANRYAELLLDLGSFICNHDPDYRMGGTKAKAAEAALCELAGVPVEQLRGIVVPVDDDDT